ncbi:hypothetical protein GYA19_00585 [Candidatus Beckwithbacteria bacterium]|nr:hypothetical protein [Candidatus Beckwithbacteria bacterium]
METSSSKKIIFLSGSMRGISREEALDWREKASQLLDKKFFKTLHAYRGRERSRNEADPVRDPKLAVARDKQDVLRSTAVLVNDSFDTTYPKGSMIGTAMEILLAKLNNIPVIVFGDAHKDNYFLKVHADVMVDTLEEACELINRLFKE